VINFIRAFLHTLNKINSRKEIEHKILLIQKEIAATLVDTSINDDMRQALIKDLKTRISALEAELD